MSDKAAWGRDHKWRHLGTRNRSTLYECTVCGEAFWHHYPRVPIIGEAAHQEGISEHCPANRIEGRE